MQSNYEILIVDNVNENIEVAEGILRSDDYTFTKALSSKEAMSVLKSKRFDLMILDVEMADIDGLHLCKIVKNSPAIADTPMIFVTSKVDIKSIEQAFKLGAVDYVTKPFHPIELQSRVASHLELYRHKKELKKINKILHTEMDAEKKQTHYRFGTGSKRDYVHLNSNRSRRRRRDNVSPKKSGNHR